jgi:hypothetical protein
MTTTPIADDFAAIAAAMRGTTPPDTAGDDAQLIAACRAFIAADRAVHTCVGDIPEALFETYYEPLERLTALPARTAEGLRAKAEAARVAFASVAATGDGHREELAALAALHDVAGAADGLAPAGSAQQATLEDHDTQLLRLCSELAEVYEPLRQWDADEIKLSEDQAYALCARRHAAFDAIEPIRPHTAAGLRAKAVALQSYIDCTEGFDSEEARRFTLVFAADVIAMG